PSFYPDGGRVLFGSTFQSGAQCPAPPPTGAGFFWSLAPTFQLYAVKNDAKDIFPIEPAAPSVYNSEASVCKNGSVVFTTTRDGDPELYTATLDSLGTLNGVKRITKFPGYDGGASFSPDCQSLVWRASRPAPGAELARAQELLKKDLVDPTRMDVWISAADGSGARQLTSLPGTTLAPVFTPDGMRILFASNQRDPESKSFDLYLIGTNGTGLERVTFSGAHESFPVFSRDGKRVAFSSGRGAAKPYETNLFVADWIDQPAESKPGQTEADEAWNLVLKLSSPEMEGRGVGTAGLPKAEDLIAERFRGAGLSPISDLIQKDPSVHGFFQDVEILDPVTQKTMHARNVIGYAGSCTAKNPVIIGAHLDHLGNGGEGSLEPSRSGIHPGADDNASGVAAIVDVARRVRGNSLYVGAEVAISPSINCYIFAAFTGEEIGIAGSSKLAELLEQKKFHPKAMLNLDMVGRLLGNKLIIFGTDTAKEWKGWVQQVCANHHLECPGGGDGYGPSDHMAFYLKKIPVLHFFTGPHLDYHRTTDTFEKINSTGIIQTANVVEELAKRVSNPHVRLHYVKASAAPSMGKLSLHGKKSSGAYLGTIPDYSSMTSPHGPSGAGEPGGGVKLAGTRPGSPADKAGIQAGDVLLSIAGRKIATLQQFMEALMALKPGDKVDLLVRRGERELSLPATIGKRE
ncbi:MAG: M28 family peptidase, partial [Bdellovibrionota bacterium]